MTRKIKFRAWDKKNKVMINVWGINQIRICREQYATDFGGGTWEPIEDFEIMEFTGLHDKNGKEIYEGDIVINSSGEILGEIVMDNGCWKTKTGACIGCFMCEVVGNIYKNAELLKSK